jgi:hypothetical protein
MDYSWLSYCDYESETQLIEQERREENDARYYGDNNVHSNHVRQAPPTYHCPQCGLFIHHDGLCYFCYTEQGPSACNW